VRNAARCRTLARFSRQEKQVGARILSVEELPDPCRLARQVKELPDPCRLVRQVKEFGR
jgi:hypothetical protein